MSIDEIYSSTTDLIIYRDFDILKILVLSNMIVGRTRALEYILDKYDGVDEYCLSHIYGEFHITEVYFTVYILMGSVCFSKTSIVA